MNDGERKFFLRRFFSFNTQSGFSNNLNLTNLNSGSSNASFHNEGQDELDDLNEFQVKSINLKSSLHCSGSNANTNNATYNDNTTNNEITNIDSTNYDAQSLKRYSSMKNVTDSSSRLDANNNDLKSSRKFNLIQNQLQQQQSIELQPFTRTKTNSGILSVKSDSAEMNQLLLKPNTSTNPILNSNDLNSLIQLKESPLPKYRFKPNR